MGEGGRDTSLHTSYTAGIGRAGGGGHVTARVTNNEDGDTNLAVSVLRRVTSAWAAASASLRSSTSAAALRCFVRRPTASASAASRSIFSRVGQHVAIGKHCGSSATTRLKESHLHHLDLDRPCRLAVGETV